MLTVIHVTQVVLLALEEDHSEAVQSKSASNVVVQYTCTQIEALVVLTGLSELALFLRQFTHLEVYVSFFQEVALLDSSFSFHDQVLSRLSSRV